MNVSAFRLGKHGTVVGLLRFSPYFLFACAAINRATLALKTTIIEDTHLTLIGILSKVEANNFLIFLPLQTYEKKSFHSFTVYNSLGNTKELYILTETETFAKEPEF